MFLFFIFGLKLHCKQQVTCGFSNTPCLSDKINDVICIVEFRIKGDNSVNDTEIQKKQLDSPFGFCPKSIQIEMHS